MGSSDYNWNAAAFQNWNKSPWIWKQTRIRTRIRLYISTTSSNFYHWQLTRLMTHMHFYCGFIAIVNAGLVAWYSGPDSIWVGAKMWTSDVGRREMVEKFCVSVFASFWATRKPLKVRIKERINKGKREKVVKWREGKLFFEERERFRPVIWLRLRALGRRKRQTRRKPKPFLAQSSMASLVFAFLSQKSLCALLCFR